MELNLENKRKVNKERKMEKREIIQNITTT